MAKKLKEKTEYVSKEDFDGFRSSIVNILENISNKLNEEPERKVVMATETKKEDKQEVNEPSNKPIVHNLIAEHQKIFDKYFDMNDGFIAQLKGVHFSISVPLHLSNAQDAHKKFYKTDIRFKVLDGHDIEGSIEKYCKLVAQNLNYKRNIKLKI